VAGVAEVQIDGVIGWLTADAAEQKQSSFHPIPRLNGIESSEDPCLAFAVVVVRLLKAAILNARRTPAIAPHNWRNLSAFRYTLAANRVKFSP